MDDLKVEPTWEPAGLLHQSHSLPSPSFFDFSVRGLDALLENVNRRNTFIKKEKIRAHQVCFTYEVMTNETHNPKVTMRWINQAISWSHSCGP
jgi:hypothetical protein